MLIQQYSRNTTQEVYMNKPEILQVSLCGGDKCCPGVEVNTVKAEVRIGETGNEVVLDRRAWNE